MHKAPTDALRRGASALLGAWTHRCLRGSAPWHAATTAPSTCSTLAASLSVTCGSARPYSAFSAAGLTSHNPLGPPGFAFDIDGVLIRGRRVLPEALEAVKMLTTPDGAWRYPVVFMTNGGGVSEAHKAEQLSRWLGVPVGPEQVILSHSPMRELVPSLAARPVLVAGRGEVADVAAAYGLTRVAHTRQLAAALPAAVPFAIQPPEAAEPPTAAPTAPPAPLPPQPPGSPLDPAAPSPPGHQPPGNGSHVSRATPPAYCPVRHGGLGSEAAPFEAVLVMTDPDDWYRDAQLICDVLQGAGVPTRSAAAAAAAGAPHVKLVFSNPDLLWANEFPTPRFGCGAFAHMVLTLYGRLTGGARPHGVTFYGKPNPQPYRLAERLLAAQAVALGLAPPPPAAQPGVAPSLSPPPAPFPLSAIFAVGDNPAADVRGANGAGEPWVSVLVRTGVFQGPGPNCDVDTARIAVDDVAAGVVAALHAARSMRWHSMR